MMPAGIQQRETRIHIVRDGVAIEPPMTFEEARRQLSERKLQPDDWAWCEGLPDWMALSAVVSHAEQDDVTLRDRPVPVQDDSGSPTHPAGDQIRIKPSGAITRLLSLLHRNVKRERVTSRQMGEGLWAFSKKASRDLHAFVRQFMEKSESALDEAAEFNATQEILLANLWLISKILASDRKVVIALHHIYFTRQGKVSETFTLPSQREDYLKTAKEKFVERFSMYGKMWNTKSKADQTVLASYMLDFMFQGSDHHAMAGNKALIGHMNCYIRSMAQTVLDLREQFEIRDSLSHSSAAL